jgi:hypothetical protein
VTFADQQAVFAKEEAEAELACGERIFENVQSISHYFSVKLVQLIIL